MKRFIFTLVIVLMLSAGAYAQWSIVIDGIESDGAAGRPDTVIAGTTVKIHMRYQNLSNVTYSFTNGFRIYSPDGAQWYRSAPLGNYFFPGGQDYGPALDTISPFFPSGLTIPKVRCFNCDGAGVDTIGVGSVSIDVSQGLTPQFDRRAFTILVKTRIADTNKHICIDSVMSYPPTNKWKWASFSGTPFGTQQPTWSGTRCFTLWYPCPLAPFFSICPVTVSNSHCNTFSVSVQAQDPCEGGPLTYQMVSGPGSIDSLTGQWTASNVPPGQHVVEIGARNYEGTTVSCVFNLHSINVPFSIADPVPVIAPVGAPSQLALDFTGDCDPIHFTLLNSPGVAGAYTLDTVNKIMHFQPDPADAGLPQPVQFIFRAADDYGDVDTIAIPFIVRRPCAGTVGNINCDLGENVDIGDVTCLLDNLFITFAPLCSPGEANCDGDANENIDIGDITALLDNLYITFIPLPACQ